MSTVVIRVRGSASAEVPPDYAVLSVSVSARHDSERAEAVAGASLTLDLLRGTLDDVDDVLEVRFGRMSVQRERRRDDDSEPGFVATVSGTVRAAAERAGAVAELVTGAGGDLGHVNWILDEDSPACRHVRASAVADAERAAQDFADALGRELGPITLLADPGAARGVTLGGEFAGAARAGGSAPALELDPVPVKVSASVEAEYLA